MEVDRSPVEGSSKKITLGCAMKAMATLNLLFIPPLHTKEGEPYTSHPFFLQLPAHPVPFLLARTIATAMHAKMC